MSRAQTTPVPQVWSIQPDTSAGATPLTFIVTFSHVVSGVDTTDFVLLHAATDASIQDITSSDMRSYRVVVIPGSSSGAIQLALIDDDTIRAADDMPLGGVGSGNGNAISSSYEITPSPPRMMPADLVKPQQGAYFVGSFNSLALTKSDTAVISYYDEYSNDLRLTICNDLLCSAPTIRVLDSNGDVGKFSSLALTPTNIPVISYYDATNGDLKLAICNNPQCTAPTIRVIDSTSDTGVSTSLQLTSTNNPVMSYYDFSNKIAKIAVCKNPTCSLVELRSISAGLTAMPKSLALTSTNIPVISYHDYTNANLKLMVCNTVNCDSTQTPRVIDNNGNVGTYSTLAMTSDNIPVMIYYDVTNGNLKMAICNNTNCLMPTLRIVDSTGDAGEYHSLKLTKSNIPVMSYTDTSKGTLKLAWCDTLTCANPTIQTLDILNTMFAIEYNSLALTSTGIPIVSYKDYYNGNLKIHLGMHTIDTGLPFAFAKTAPANNATSQPVNTTLKWTPSAFALTYDYCIATSIAACTTWLSTGSTPQVQLAGLSKNTTYYWQVRAFNAAGTLLANSAHWKFTTVK